jgi:hypothetical protein
MKHSFSLFQSHLDFAHAHWAELVQIGDSVIDSTCGNGHDMLKLCQLALSSEKGFVYGFDIQEKAIQSTRHHLEAHLQPEIIPRVHLYNKCHSDFLPDILPGSIKLIVYNLGYLPGGDKAQTTKTSLTIQSINRAATLLQPGGMISITCYPGHPEGAIERDAVALYASSLPPEKWSSSHHLWTNRKNAPSVILIQKCLEQGQNPLRSYNKGGDDSLH